MLSKIVEGKNLSFEEAYELFNTLLNESPIRIAAYLASIQSKGYTAEELAGFAKAMRDNATQIDLGTVCDTCGTGGDYSSTINVSTASTIILSCFKRVAKHGNVSITSKSGSANVLDALGIRIDLEPEEAMEVIKRTNFVFLFAPIYHKALKKIMPIRKELKIKTIFNVLGPLSNPANPKYQIIGVNSRDLVDRVASALNFLNVKKALVVFGDGLDEVSPRSETVVAEAGKNRVEKYRVVPEDFGLDRVKIIPCGSPEESAKRIKAVLSGGGLKEDRNFIMLNASMAIYSAGFEDFKECREMVESVLEGMGLKKLEEIRNACPKV
jgi:anthranilate phosphoribosyltransferase